MDMTLGTLDQEHLDRLMDLFCLCFAEDHFYAHSFPEEDTRAEKMRAAFAPSVADCLAGGLSLGVWQGEELKAFALVFDYDGMKAQQPAGFADLFGGRLAGGELQLPYSGAIHDRLEAVEEPVRFLLSIAVHPKLQRQGLAAGLVDRLLVDAPGCALASDVSHEGSLELYRRRGFSVEPIEEGYWLVLHHAGAAAPAEEAPLRLLVPPAAHPNGPQPDRARPRLLVGARTGRGQGTAWFEEDPSAVAPALLVEPETDAFWAWQRWLNMAHYAERTAGGCLYYTQQTPYRHPLLYNDLLREMTKNRTAEWGLAPDVYVSVPVRYSDRTLDACRQDRPASQSLERLLKVLEFRTYYESGIPSLQGRVDDLASFKRRIRRCSLGQAEVQVTDEITPDRYQQTGDPIGQPGLVDLYLSMDTESGCGVLTLFGLAAPFLLSHLMDNVARNQLLVVQPEGLVNLYDWLDAQFGVTKRGTAKVLVTLPHGRECLADSQIASLLACETIYPEGENFGRIVDQDILERVESETGMGQYDRAFVCAHTNVLLQFCPELPASLEDRILEESVSLFYVELILLEEAAIHIADQQIVQLFGDADITSPVKFLERADDIYDTYARTIDFWNIQLNYPTSQKSMQMLRDAFEVDRQLEWMQRNLDHMKLVFETKCDLIDRKESKRMDTSLAVLSVLAVFSAWIDGHDYISTWEGVLSPQAVTLLQRGLFVVVGALAVYVAVQVFGKKRE